MKERTEKLINNLIIDYSLLDKTQTEETLKKCGRACSKNMGSSQKAKKIRERISDKDDIDLLIKTFGEEVYKDSPVYRKDNTIILKYLHKKCPCPVVEEFKIDNPIYCNCTIGHTQAIFENLLDRKVEVVLIKSVLRGDDCCIQEIHF